MVKIKDVAKLAGVGVGTVSRYLNSPDKVSAAVKVRIKAAIEETGYVRNELGRNLKTNNSRNVALLMPSIFHNFFAAFAFHTEQILSAKDYKVIIGNSLSNIDKDREYLEMLRSNKLSGIIGFIFTDIDEFITPGLPFISIDRNFANKVTYVSSDNYEGGQIAAEKLLKAGARNPAFIGTYSKNIDTDVRFRKTGFIDYLKNQNIPYLEYTVEDPIKDYDAFLNEFFDLYMSNVDGIFFENDNLGYLFMEEAKKRGIKVPEELKIIGFDGIHFESIGLTKITTIEQQIDLLAKEACTELLKIIENQEISQKKVVVPVKYVKGSTT